MCGQILVIIEARRAHKAGYGQIQVIIKVRRAHKAVCGQILAIIEARTSIIVTVTVDSARCSAFGH